MCACALSATAQNFTEHIQANDENGKLTITSSASLDSLINGITPHVEEIVAEAKSETANTIHTSTGTAHPAAPKANTGTTASTGTTKRKETGVNHVIKSGESVTVYSIQVYSGGNSREAKEKAQAIAAQVNAKFPGSGARASFSSPRWVVVTGAYASQEIATANLKRMKSMGFTQASIFRRTVVKR